MPVEPTVLLVDDDAVILAATKHLLEQAHLRCQTASTASEAVALAATLRPQLVLLDLDLPDSSGTEVLRQIRSQPNLESVSVVFLTSARTPPDTHFPGVEGGADGFISRPLSNADLLTQVRLHLGQWDQKEKLRVSQARFRNLITDLPDAVLVVNQAGVIQFANAAAADLFGQPAAALCGSTFGFPLGETGRAEVEVPLPPHAGRVAAMRILPTTWDGEPAWLASLRELTERKRLQDALAEQTDVAQRLTRDIAERKRTEANLLASGQQMRLFIDHVPASLAMFDRDMRYLAYSRRWLEEFGQGRADLTGVAHYELYPGLPAHWKDAHRRGLAGEVVQMDEDHLVWPGGTEQWLSWSVRPWHDVHGEIGGIVIFSENITARKQAEAALRESEERLRFVVRGSRLGLWDWNIVTGDVQRNERWAEMLGFTLEEIKLTVTQWADLIHPDDRAAAWKSIDDHLNGRTDGHACEYRMRTKAGDYRWILDQARVMARDAQGRPLRMSGTHTDIHARKQAEKALHASEWRQRVILDNIPDPAWLKDAAGRFLAVNQSWCEFTGVPADRAVGQLDSDLFGPEVAKRFREEERRLEGTGTMSRTEEQLLDATGKACWFETFKAALRDEEDQGYLHIGIARDITERKQAEATLAASEQRLRDVINSVAGWVWEVDAAGRCTYASPRVQEILGYTPEEMTGKLPPETMTPAEFARLAPVFDRARRECRPIENLEVWHRRKDGTLMCALSNGVALKDAAGNFAGARGVDLDITDRKRAEEALRRSEGQLQAAQAVAHVGSWQLDLLQDRVVWSDEVCRIFDLSKPPQTYPEFLALVHPDDRLRLDQAWQAALAGAPYDIEHRIMAAGEIRWVHQQAAFERDAFGRVVACLGTVQDVTPVKRAEAALRRSEAHLRTLVNTLPDLVWLKDPQGVYLACNRRFESLFGATVAEIVGKTDYAFVDRALADSLRANDEAAVAAGGPRTNEEEIEFAADGHREILETTKAPLLDEEGRLIGVLGVAHNITERKRLEADLRQLNLALEQRVAERTAALQASEERLALAFRATQDGIWDWNLETGEVFFSARYKSMLGYEEAELEHHVSVWERLLHPDDLRPAQEVVKGVLRGERDYAMEFRMRHKDGHYVDILSRGWPLRREPGGPIVRIVGTHYDLTERKQAEAQLQKLWHAVEHSPVAVVITDHTAAIEYVNPQFERDTGFTAAEALGQNPRLLKSGVHPPEFYAGLWQILRNGQTWRGELCNRRKDGSLYWALAAIAPVFDGAGRSTHYVAITEDITDRRRAAEELREARDQAEAANRAKSVFLARMSHEIRTPMNAVLGFTQLLLRDAGTSLEQRQRLNTILRSGEHLLNIINEILEFARIESGRDRLKNVPFDLRSLLRDVEMMFSLRAQSQRFRFSVVAPPGPIPALVGDHTKLRQVLINLLGNAFKFTPAGGEVSLRVQTTVEPDGRVRLCAQVQDTGPGLAPEDAARVFDPFFQTAAGQAAGGTGLGLSISRGVARLMQGDLTVSSPAQGGACFEFVARLETAEAGEELEAAPEPTIQRVGAAWSGYPLLVVDDEPHNRELLLELLAPMGFSLRAVTHGLEAVQLCRTWRPGLVILDLQMPVMDGYEAARQLRAEHGMRIKMLVLSASVEEEVRRRALAAGADVFLGKPFQPAELLDCIHALVGVEYERGEPATPRSEGESPRSGGMPSAEALRRLPADWVAEFQQALAVADYDAMLALVERIQPLDQAMACQLRARVEAFDYATLETLLNPSQSVP